MTKMQKFASIGNKILKVLFWINTISCTLASIGAFILLCLTSTAPFLLSPNTLIIGFLEFTLPLENAPRLPHSSFLLMVLYVWVVYGFATYIMRQLRLIFTAVADGRPFQRQISLAIRHIAFAQLLAGILYHICKDVAAFLIYQVYQMDTLFLNSSILHCKTTYSVDPSVIWVFLLLFLLSYVFQYGEELQTLSDETL